MHLDVSLASLPPSLAARAATVQVARDPQTRTLRRLVAVAHVLEHYVGLEVEPSPDLLTEIEDQLEFLGYTVDPITAKRPRPGRVYLLGD